MLLRGFSLSMWKPKKRELMGEKWLLESGSESRSEYVQKEHEGRAFLAWEAGNASREHLGLL